MPNTLITAQQCRAARTALGWDRARLASEADVSMETIRRLELGHKILSRTNRALRNALESEGIEFTKSTEFESISWEVSDGTNETV